MAASLKAFGLNCTLKPGRKSSSTEVLMEQLFAELAKYDVEGDAWPALLEKLLAADILVIGSPIWLGQPSSIAKRVLERMDAFIDEKDERGRMPSYGKVAICAIVGNEDGAHHSAAEILSALLEVGFTVPSGGPTYWVGEAMGSKDYKDFKEAPAVVTKWTAMLASNTAHLARLLKAANYPGLKGGR